MDRDVLIGELKVRLERIEGRLDGILARIGPDRPPDDGRTHLRRVLDVLRESGGEWLSSAEIAARAMIDPGSARMVLYGRRDLFRCERVSAGRVKWQINPQQRFQEIIAPEPVMAEALQA